MTRKAEKIQVYADRNERKNFSAIKTVISTPIKGTVPLLSSDGSTLLMKKSQSLRRWTEHFRSALNRPSTISDEAAGRLPQVEINVGLDPQPLLAENIRTVQQLFSRKASGCSAILAEIYKYDGHRPMNHLSANFQEMWPCGQILQDLNDATIIHL
nr:unnamed protein product [Spirometra erinaceieuropaei]